MALDRAVIQRVPVLAVEDYALLPGTVAALHVFEPSHRELVDDCEASDRLLVVAGLEADSEREVVAVREVAGLAKLVNVQALDDGSREIFLHGLARVRLLRLRGEVPYRTAQVERLGDVLGRGERRRLRPTVRRLHDYVHALLRAGIVAGEESRLALASDDPGTLSYRLGDLLLSQATERQRLLEQASPLARLELLIEAAARHLMTTIERDGAVRAPGRPAPPPSLN